MRALDLAPIERVPETPSRVIAFRWPATVDSPMRMLIDRVPDDKWAIRIGRWYKRRSSGLFSQNSEIHRRAQIIALETGNDLNTVKFAAKKIAMAMGYPPLRHENGDVVISVADGEPVPESSAKINTIEAGYLIEALAVLGSQLGIYV